MESYTVHEFKRGDILLASQLNEMDEQIASLTRDAQAGGAYKITEGSTGVEIFDNTTNA